MAVSILFISAVPRGTDRIEIDDEYRTIDQALRGTSRSDQFTLLPPALAARADDFQTRLLRDKPAVVHWSGHGQLASRGDTRSGGVTARELFPPDLVGEGTPTDGGRIVVWGAEGQPEALPTEPFASLFGILRGRLPTKCVVLNACFTEAQAIAIAEHVSFVVGTTEALPDRAALAFSKGFYEAIGEGESLESAFALGKNAIAMKRLGNPGILKRWTQRHVDANTLVLTGAYSGAPDRPRFDELTLTGPQLKSCEQALLDAFPTREDMEVLLLHHLDVRLDEITGKRGLVDAYFDLLKWARARGRLGELFAQAIEANPGNPKLKSVVARIWAK